jgi:PadR family transcriptional regulator
MALMSDQAGLHWGYDLSRRAGVRSGVLYPLLSRMLEEGWLTDGWETTEEARGRPPRRYYQLTDYGRRELGGLLDTAQLDPRFAALFRLT